MDAEPGELLALARTDDVEALGEDRAAVSAGVRAFAEAGDPASALELFARAWRIWLVSGDLDAGREAAAVALSASGKSDTTSWRTRALYADGVLAFRTGDTEASRHRNAEALSLAVKAGDSRGECDALTGLARVALRRGEYDEVVALARHGRACARASGDRAAEVSPLHLEAAGVRLQRDYAAARQLYTESLELNESLGNQDWVTTELDCLGWVELHLGNVSAAEARFRDRDARVDDDPYAMAWRELGWAAVAALHGDLNEARRLHATATKGLLQLTNVLDPDDQAEVDWLAEQL